ncbi:MAG: chemotaxis-specific protein-glutamate methyltransferase CheB [Gemmatimonadaceae bacterium]
MTKSAPIRVLIAEDSSTARALLTELFSSSPDFVVAGTAVNGSEAIERAIALSPDLIIMDVYMPVVDGLDATKEIMRESPTPIVMVSASVAATDVAMGLSATQAGAMILLAKPSNTKSPEFPEECRQLLSMAKAMAGVKVVRRWGGGAARVTPPSGRTAHPVRRVTMVAIGTSTGGPAALHRILIDLPPTFPVPIVVVQHMARGFIDGLAKWLSANVALKVVVAEDGQRLVAGTVYLAPDERHMGVRGDGRVALSSAAAVSAFRPSIDFLFDAYARGYDDGLVALILTGMGQDGVEGLKTVRTRGGRVIAQDERSSVVFGMAQKAVEANLVHEILPLDGIGRRLNELVDAVPR